MICNLVVHKHPKIRPMHPANLVAELHVDPGEAKTPNPPRKAEA